MAAEDDQFQGRKPSYDRHGRVRGFRTRQGAPLHDPTNNIPIGGERSTPINWQSTFRNTPGSTYIGASGPKQPSTIEELGYDPAGVAMLETLAGGGMNHAQQWSQPPKPKSAWGDVFVPPMNNAVPGMAAAASMGGTRQVGMRPLAKPLTDADGNAVTDAANLRQSQSMYAPGGMLMDLPDPNKAGWETTSNATAKSIFDRYKTKDKRGYYVPPRRDAMGSGRDLNRNNSFGWASAFT